MASNTLYQQSEIVRKGMLPFWATQDYGVLTDFVAKGEVEVVGERDYRIPFQKWLGGRSGHVDLQLGDYGRGSSPAGDVMLQSFYTARMNFELDELQIDATASAKTAIKSPFLQCTTKGMMEFQLIWDKWIHGNGTAALATATAHSSSSGVSVYTMETGFGVQLLRRGQYYTIYDSTLATVKSSGVLYVTALNTQARTIALSGIVPSAASTDVICFEGVSGANPVGPRGIKYWVSSAVSGTTAGINRALESQMISKSVDGTNGLTVEAVMALNDRIMMDRGKVPDLMGLVAPAQRAYAFSNMVAIQMNLIEGKASTLDRLPKLKGKQYFDWGGIPHYVDIHQDATVAMYMVGSDFGRARLAAPGFTQLPGVSGEAGRFFRLTGASGGPAAGVWFGFCIKDDLYCCNPGEQGLINNLPLGAFYA